MQKEYCYSFFFLLQKQKFWKYFFDKEPMLKYRENFFELAKYAFKHVTGRKKAYEQREKSLTVFSPLFKSAYSRWGCFYEAEKSVSGTDIRMVCTIFDNHVWHSCSRWEIRGLMLRRGVARLVQEFLCTGDKSSQVPDEGLVPSFLPLQGWICSPFSIWLSPSRPFRLCLEQRFSRMRDIQWQLVQKRFRALLLVHATGAFLHPSQHVSKEENVVIFRVVLGKYIGYAFLQLIYGRSVLCHQLIHILAHGPLLHVSDTASNVGAWGLLKCPRLVSPRRSRSLGLFCASTSLGMQLCRKESFFINMAGSVDSRQKIEFFLRHFKIN